MGGGQGRRRALEGKEIEQSRRACKRPGGTQELLLAWGHGSFQKRWEESGHRALSTLFPGA